MAPPPTSHPWRSLLVLIGILVVLYGGMAGSAAFGSGSWSPKLGLDLEGGTTVTLIPRAEEGQPVTSEAIDQAVAIIRQRVDAFGVSESSVTAEGSGNQRSIVIAIPGSQNRRILDQVRQTAQLRFRPVLAVAASGPAAPSPTPSAPASPAPSLSPSPAPTGSPSPAASGGSGPALQPGQSSSPAPRAVPWRLTRQGAPVGAVSTPATPAPVAAGAAATPAPSAAATPSAPAVAPSPPATGAQDPFADLPPELISRFEKLDCTDPATRPGDVPAPRYMVACQQDGTYKFLLAPADVVGTDIATARAGLEVTQTGATTNRWEVQLQFTDEGARKFLDSTTRLSAQQPPRNQFAIVLDGKVVSAPYVDNPIPGGQARITGDFTQQEAQDLANVLRYGALPLSFEPGDVQEVSPTLGQDQLRAGLLAGAIGLALVVVYSLLYYRALGSVSIFSLVVAGLIAYAAVVLLGTLIGFRLSLAGVAGLIVAVGITADSFIVYFERLRDELREGRSLRAAVELAWLRARRTVLAADFVSFLAAAVLYLMSVGAVRGFAFTLGLTTIIDVLVVFVFTKPIVTLLARRPFFATGHRWSGLEASHIGAPIRPSAPAGGRPTTIAARKAATAAAAAGSTQPAAGATRPAGGAGRSGRRSDGTGREP